MDRGLRVSITELTHTREREREKRERKRCVKKKTDAFKYLSASFA